jgi:hypothetical protein
VSDPRGRVRRAGTLERGKARARERRLRPRGTGPRAKTRRRWSFSRRSFFTRGRSPKESNSGDRFPTPQRRSAGRRRCGLGENEDSWTARGGRSQREARARWTNRRGVKTSQASDAYLVRALGEALASDPAGGRRSLGRGWATLAKKCHGSCPRGRRHRDGGRGDGTPPEGGDGRHRGVRADGEEMQESVQPGPHRARQVRLRSGTFPATTRRRPRPGLSAHLEILSPRGGPRARADHPPPPSTVPPATTRAKL